MAYADSQIMMTLAAIAYAQPKDLRSYLLPTTNPPNATQGDWALVWGPAVTAIDAGNLMFVTYDKPICDRGPGHLPVFRPRCACRPV